MPKAVHFHGVNKIVEAFENKQVPFFAVVSDKCVIHKNDKIETMEEAATDLETFLGMLNEGSNAVYTLRIYETAPAGGIKENTPADYSLNFRLNLPDMLPESVNKARYYEAKTNQTNEILSELKALHARLDKIEEEEIEEEEEEQPEGIAGVLNGTINSLIQNPEVQQMIAGKLVGWLGGLTGSQPAAIAGIPATATEISEEVQDKIDQAVDTLAQNTPGGAVLLCEKLEKLAAMSVNNAGQYQMLLKML